MRWHNVLKVCAVMLVASFFVSGILDIAFDISSWPNMIICWTVNMIIWYYAWLKAWI